jgi:adenine-specific DNA methylase
VRIELPLVEAETFPPRYRLHKYWGKKPANVVAAYIEAFSRKGETVLDPFCGSGVSVAEAIASGRKAVGIDLNPVAVRITRTRLRTVPLELLDRAFLALEARMGPLVDPLCKTTCDRCGGQASIVSTVFDSTEPQRVKLACSCFKKVWERAIADRERQLVTRTDLSIPKYPDAPLFFGWQMQKLRRAGLERFSDLFTAKNLFVLAHLRRAILDLDDDRCRDLLLLTFTANLAQCTRMIADYSGAAGGPSWKVNSYWVPKVWQDLDPWHYFANRFQKTRAAVADMIDVLANSDTGEDDARIFCGDSASTIEREVEPSSIDFVFTDPPYGGEGIQYGELSMLWNLWLGEQESMEREIAFNPYQQKDEHFYAGGLARVFAATARALKPAGLMAVTFNNKELEVWEALMRACREAGFALEGVAPLSRSAPAVTEKNAAKAPKADLVLLFSKRSVASRRGRFSLDRSVRAAVRRLERDGSAPSTRQIQDLVLCDWFTACYGDRSEAPRFSAVEIEDVLKRGASAGGSRRA